jgi:LPS O-antigen subunit length determinant protein (WzzB/FepE family)
MENDIIILISLLAAALGLLLAILIKEEVQQNKQYNSAEIERLARVERIKHLTNKL